MKIYLILHGQSTSDIEDKYGGSHDDHLTDEGKMQAEELAEKLSNKGIQAIFYSPLLRAKETALILQNKLKIELQVTDNFRERNRYGILTGLVKAEAKDMYPELVEVVKHMENTINGAEKFEEFKMRVLSAFEQVTNLPHKTVAIVTHGGPMFVLFQELFGREMRTTEDCGFAVIDKEGNSLSLISIEKVHFV